MTSGTTMPIKRSHFLQGMQAAVSVAIGYMPIALTYGLLAKSTGLSFFETVMMSILVFAGAAQYIALNLIVLGTGAFEMIFTIFIVNIRHFLMTTSLAEKLERGHPLIRSIVAFGVTDETFAVSATRKGVLSTGFMLGLCFLAYASWVINSGVGYIVGSFLPESLQQSMGIALYAMFIGLLVPSLKKSRKVFFLAGFAAVLNSVLSLFLSIGWAIIFATLAASVTVELFPKGEKGDA